MFYGVSFTGTAALIADISVFLLRIFADLFGEMVLGLVCLWFSVLFSLRHKVGILFLANTLLYRW